MEYIHAIINIFAGGRSEIKVYLFAAYLISILTIGVVYSRKKEASVARNKKASILFVSSTTLLFLIGVALHLFFLHSIGSPLTDISVFFNNGEISSSSIFHNHFMKGSIAALYTYFSSGVIEGVDIGTAYVGLYSNIIYLFSLFLLLVSIVSSLFFFKNQIQKKEYKTNIIIYSLIYSIFTFSILKNTIDGGILNTEAIPFIFGLYLLVSNSYLKINKNIFIGVTGFTLIIIFLQNVLVTLNIAVLSVISIPHLTGVLSLMILLLYIHFLRSSQEKRSYIKSNYFFALILIISVCGFYYSTKDSLDTISYKNTELSAGDQVFVFSRKDIAEPGLLESYRIGDMRFYKGRIESNASVGSLVKKTAAPLNFEPVSVVGKACQMYGRPKKLYFNLVDLSDTTNKLNIQTFKEDNNEFFTIDSIDIISNNTNQMHNEYSVSASVHPCVGREVEIIQQMFVTHGLKSFVIFNISFN